MKKNILMLTGALLLGAAAMLAVANTSTIKEWLGVQPEQPSETASGGKKDPVQIALLNEMSTLLKQYDTTNTSYYLGGNLTATDRSDSANALKNITYKIGKWDQQLYSRIGETETINNKEVYLYIDHAAKKIMLSKHKTVVQQGGLSFDKLYEYVRGEGFLLNKKTEGNLLRIGILNPNHLSLKGISIAYDSVTRQVRNIKIRQADVTDHMNENKEKWISLDITEWNEDPDPVIYLNERKFIVKKNGQWQCTAAFQDYELINQYAE